jgi:plastocyanin
MRSSISLRLAACAVLATQLGAARQPAVHEVRMVSDGKTAHFEPAEITAHPGDAIRFVNAAGGPHNVSFEADKLPADVRAALQEDLPEQIQPLWGKLLTTPGEAYTVRLNGVRPGRYEFFCMPHMAMGMKGVLVVR